MERQMKRAEINDELSAVRTNKKDFLCDICGVTLNLRSD